MFSVSFALALAVAGICAGLLAGMFGVGGGIVLVPVMFFLFQAFGIHEGVALDVATATSLACIIPTSISSIRSHHLRGNIDWTLVKSWIPAMVLGVLLGTWVIRYLPGSELSLLFAIIAIFAALNLIFKPSASLRDTLPSRPIQHLLAMTIGSLSTMVGIGGGSLTVPTLSACNYETRRAVGSAAAFGLVISLPSAASLLLGQTPAGAPATTFGLVNLLAFMLIVPFSISMAPIGARIASSLNPLLLKRLFALMLCITALRMAYQAF